MIIDGALAAYSPRWILNGAADAFGRCLFPFPRLRDTIPCTGKGAERANAGKMGTGWIDRTSGEDERKSRDRSAHRATVTIDKPVANRY
jgi:hypothetical protein